MADNQAMKSWVGFGPPELDLLDRFAEQSVTAHPRYMTALARALHDGTMFEWNGAKDPVREIARAIGERPSHCMKMLRGEVTPDTKRIRRKRYGARPPPTATPKYTT